MRFKYEVEISDQNSPNWAGHRGYNTTCSRRYLFNVWEPFFGRISWWVTNWAMQLISIVFLCRQGSLHQFFTLIGNDEFSTSDIRTDFTSKCGKNGTWYFGFFLAISARSSRILKMFGPACTLLCPRVSVFQFSSRLLAKVGGATASGGGNPLLGLPSSWETGLVGRVKASFGLNIPVFV